MASVLDRVAEGLVSFGTGIPQSEIDNIRANRDINQSNARIAEINAQIAEGEPARIDAEARRQAQLDALRQAAAGGDQRAIEQLIAIDPKVGADILKAGGINTKQRLEAASRFTAAMLATDDPAQQDALIRQRITEVANREGDPGNPQDTASLLDMTPEEREPILRTMQAATQTQGNATSKLGAGALVRGPDGELAFSAPVLTPDGNLVTQTSSLPAGSQVVTRQGGETPGEVQERTVETAGGSQAAREAAITAEVPDRDAAKTAAERRTNNITAAITAADAAPVISRAIELLDSVDTGGFAAAALAAKQTFGIESADEAELSNSLGKAVLSQLRDTFGAAFTEGEGQRLERIEASFGKSTEGNKRLLSQAKRLLDRAIDRGINSAIENEDFGAAQQIKDARDFSLSTEAPLSADEQAELERLRAL